MKIIILQGSPNKNGSTSILVEEFTRGAKSSGHSVKRFDIAEMNIKPCSHCVSRAIRGFTHREATAGTAGEKNS